MTRVIGPVIRVGLLVVRAGIWAGSRWIPLCVGVPMRIWWWIWRRPLPWWRRLSFAFAPWVFLGMAVAPSVIVQEVAGETVPAMLRIPYVMTAYAARAERRALERVLAGVASFASPSEPPPDSRPRHAPRARRGRSQEPEPRPPLEIFGRLVAVLVGVFVAVPFTISVVFGGPVYLPILLLARRRRGGAATVSGRPFRNVSFRRFPSWRRKGDARVAWFVGASSTGKGPLWLDTESRLMHTWVVGATGTGKTQSVLLPALRSDILAGRTAIFIDGKGDRETLSAIAAFAREAGRESDLRCFDVRRPEQSHSYSPLLNGTPNEQTDKIMAALRWDNEFYRAQSKATLLRVLRSLQAIGTPYSLENVLAALSDLSALRALSAAVHDSRRRAELEQIAGRWKEYLVETSGMRSQLEALLMTDFGELLKDSRPTLDLAEAYRTGAIVYFALPVARFPETAPLVTKLVISDLNSVAGMVQDGQLERVFASVVIDEFAAFAMPLFVDLLNKGRSAGMAITISHQSMRGDLASAQEGFIDQIADNTNIKVCLRQSADAEYVAGFGGTYKTTKLTEQTTAALVGHERTGLGSAREVDEYHVSPNLVRELPRGYAVVQINHPPKLDLVRLDYVETSGLPPYSPPLQEHALRAMLEPKMPTAADDAPTPSAVGEALRFDGA
jgi:type IV secretory system conjugative DNA transfer VirD4/TraG family protein